MSSDSIFARQSGPPPSEERATRDSNPPPSTIPSDQQRTFTAPEAPLKQQKEETSQTLPPPPRTTVPTSSPSPLHHPLSPEPVSTTKTTTSSSPSHSHSLGASYVPIAPPPSPTNRQRPPLLPLGKIHGKPVIEHNRKKAAAFAQRFSNHHAPDGILPIFTDGSASPLVRSTHRDRFCSASAVFRSHAQSDDWLEFGYGSLTAKNSGNAEILGVGLGLKEGGEYIKCNGGRLGGIHTIYVFMDMVAFLDVFPKIEAGKWEKVDYDCLEEFLRRDAEMAEAGITVEYHWIPAHTGIEGNERADEVARMYRPDVMYPEYFVTLFEKNTGQERGYKYVRTADKRKLEDIE